jgi:hypothetical protein
LESRNIRGTKYHSIERSILSYECAFKNAVIVGGYDGSFRQEWKIVNGGGISFRELRRDPEDLLNNVIQPSHANALKNSFGRPLIVRFRTISRL